MLQILVHRQGRLIDSAGRRGTIPGSAASCRTPGGEMQQFPHRRRPAPDRRTGSRAPGSAQVGQQVDHQAEHEVDDHRQARGQADGDGDEDHHHRAKPSPGPAITSPVCVATARAADEVESLRRQRSQPSSQPAQPVRQGESGPSCRTPACRCRTRSKIQPRTEVDQHAAQEDAERTCRAGTGGATPACSSP